jgi:hypothetical protein
MLVLNSLTFNGNCTGAGATSFMSVLATVELLFLEVTPFGEPDTFFNNFVNEEIFFGSISVLIRFPGDDGDNDSGASRFKGSFDDSTAFLAFTDECHASFNLPTRSFIIDSFGVSLHTACFVTAAIAKPNPESLTAALVTGRLVILDIKRSSMSTTTVLKVGRNL